MIAFSESARQIVHMGAGAFALLLRYLTWWQAALLAGTALAFNLLVLPHAGGRALYRPADRARGLPAGIILYPASVLALVLLFPHRPDIAAAAWGILAVGDGMATLAGMAIGGPRLPWNRDKTLAGSAALALCGGASGAALAYWCRPALAIPPPLWFSIGVPFLAAVAAAFVETIPIRLDDNVSVPATAAAVLWAASLASPAAAGVALDRVWSALPAAIALNVGVAWLGHAARTVSLSGACAGAIIGIVIQSCLGPAGWGLLFATFVLASATSRLGLRRKTLLGIAEERGGRRGAGNAIANTGIAAAAALMSVVTEPADAAAVALAAALVAGGSDTVASEIGKAWGRRTYLIPTFAPVPPGTSGAVSIEGTAAGLAGAFALAGVAVALGIITVTALLPVVAGATIGAFAESALGATLEGPGILNNDVLNFLNTAIAAASALLIWRGIA